MAPKIDDLGDLDLGRALDVARRAVAAAGQAALPYWRSDLVVERKADQSPVTAADRAAEAAILGIVSAAFPGHDFLCEESGEIIVGGAGGPFRWIVDPLDGTRGFSRGGAFWGPLLALEHRGEIVVGAMTLPARGETYWAARGMGTYRDGERLQVSRLGEWGEATLSLGEMRHLLAPPHGPAVTQLIRGAASARCYGDLAGCAMVLCGQAEAWLEAGVQIWDIAPLKILTEEAGGRFTDFSGRADQIAGWGGMAVASNGAVHDRLLSALSSA